MADSLPADVIQAIAISNAKSIGEQPAILANLALAQQIFNQNMQQQIALSQQQAMNQVQMAAAAKCVTMIEKSDGTDSKPSMEKILKDIEDFMKTIRANSPPKN
ncbi:FAD-binding monooxygenase [Acidovorax sp. SUPP3334]|uniref:FAD-binding monooxygenase n=1 Tax=Acidovorax sp. SUPP3334 TaxID=2920881 RepID=UPI0023DE35A8|nr:FAD-binding monooxygenase [Acidovorax sp. SUPP3334]GKT26514.1 FAD-binding monooxygenase [Acidovorax sp. SUPP3334]